MNLVIALLSTRSFITAERIRETVSGYADSPSDEAFSRMFERDKNELRDLGIPLETGRVSSLDPTEGYRINRQAYALPEIELTADEAAAVAVDTQLGESHELVTATQSALLKLRAAGVYLHARATTGWKRQNAVWIALVGYGCIIMNFAVVNVFFVGQHSYSGL